MKISDIQKQIATHYDLVDKNSVSIAGIPIGGWMARGYWSVVGDFPHINELKKFYSSLPNAGQDRDLTNEEMFSLVDRLFIKNHYHFEQLSKMIDSNKIEVLRFLNSEEMFKQEYFDAIMHRADSAKLRSALKSLLNPDNKVPKNLYLQIIQNPFPEEAAWALTFVFKYQNGPVPQSHIDFILQSDPESAGTILNLLSSSDLDSSENLKLIKSDCLKSVELALSEIGFWQIELTQDYFMKIVLHEDPIAAAKAIIADHSASDSLSEIDNLSDSDFSQDSAFSPVVTPTHANSSGLRIVLPISPVSQIVTPTPANSLGSQVVSSTPSNSPVLRVVAPIPASSLVSQVVRSAPANFSVSASQTNFFPAPTHKLPEEDKNKPYVYQERPWGCFI